jgi:hypothetical protein
LYWKITFGKDLVALGYFARGTFVLSVFAEVLED